MWGDFETELKVFDWQGRWLQIAITIYYQVQLANDAP